MSYLQKLTDAKIGDRITFVYYGGSTPGEQRDVEVLEVRDDRIVAKDLKKDALRAFLANQATFVQVVSKPKPYAEAEKPSTATVKKVCLSDAISQIQEEIAQYCNYEDIAKIYETLTGRKTTFNADSGCLEMEYPVEGSMTLEEDDLLRFDNHQGQSKHLDYCRNTNKFYFGNVHESGAQPQEIRNPVELCHALAQHLGLEIQNKS